MLPSERLTKAVHSSLPSEALSESPDRTVSPGGAGAGSVSDLGWTSGLREPM